MEIQIPRSIKILILAIALIGFFDAVFLTANHYSGITPPCFVVQGCEQVTTSKYSEILGIPVALYGAIFYLVVFFTAVYFIEKRKLIVLRFLHLITTVGAIFSLWFLYVQGIIIGAWCMYCLISAGTSFSLFILGSLAIHKKWS